MNLRDQRICLWLVPVFGIALLGAFCVAGVIPPPSPTLTAQQVASFYRDNLGRIRAGMITVNLCGIMFIPFFMVIVVQMQRHGQPEPGICVFLPQRSCECRVGISPRRPCLVDRCLPAGARSAAHPDAE